jgi:hypothetical protein
VGSVRVRHAGQVPLNSEEDLVCLTVKTRGVKRASEVGHEHAVPGHVEREPDAFHQMVEDDLGFN